MKRRARPPGAIRRGGQRGGPVAILSVHEVWTTTSGPVALEPHNILLTRGGRRPTIVSADATSPIAAQRSVATASSLYAPSHLVRVVRGVGHSSARDRQSGREISLLSGGAMR